MSSGDDYVFGVFIWNKEKSRKNLEKHKIDFHVIADLVTDGDGIVAPSPQNDADAEERFILIARARGVAMAAIYTLRDGMVRVISIRKARDQEKARYEREQKRTAPQ